MRALPFDTSARAYLSRRAALRALSSLLGVVLLNPVRTLRAEEAPAFRVISHPSRPERGVERSFLADAFLKKVTRWSDGEVIRPVDLGPQTAVRQKFTTRVLKRSVRAVRNYWQQRIFSGRDVPPPELDSEEAVLVFVAKTPGAVGYVSGSAKLQGVRELAVW